MNGSVKNDERSLRPSRPSRWFGRRAGQRRSGTAAVELALCIPVVLILMGLIEFYHTSVFVVHGLGIALTLGRLLHAWGFAKSVGFGRAAGAALTWIVLLAGSLIALLIGLGVPLA